MKSDFLITGSSSGLGKYLYDNLGGISINRHTSKKEGGKIKKGVEIIIHCAFNSECDSRNQYFRDNVLLTEELTKFPHNKFIYISSVDVYPKDSRKHLENTAMDIKNVGNIYSKTKLMSEDLVKKNCPNFLILRCTALLGKASRKNSLIKILEDDKPNLTLNQNSVFNYILHSDILKFIKLAIQNDLQGIYNLASSKNITLKKVASFLKKKVNFGDYIYNVGNIDNKKITSVFPAFKKTSKEVIEEFIKQVSE